MIAPTTSRASARAIRSTRKVAPGAGAAAARGRASPGVGPRVARRRVVSSAALIESVLMAKARALRPPPFSKRGT